MFSFRLIRYHVKVKVLVASHVQILCNPMDCSPPCNSPGKNTGVGSHSFFQEIFLTQISNLGLLHFRQILYHLSHQGSPRYPVPACLCLFSIFILIRFIAIYLNSKNKIICHLKSWFFSFISIIGNTWHSKRAKIPTDVDSSFSLDFYSNFIGFSSSSIGESAVLYFEHITLEQSFQALFCRALFFAEF